MAFIHLIFVFPNWIKNLWGQYYFFQYLAPSRYNCIAIKRYTFSCGCHLINLSQPLFPQENTRVFGIFQPLGGYHKVHNAWYKENPQKREAILIFNYNYHYQYSVYPLARDRSTIAKLQSSLSPLHYCHNSYVLSKLLFT